MVLFFFSVPKFTYHNIQFSPVTATRCLLCVHTSYSLTCIYSWIAHQSISGRTHRLFVAPGCCDWCCCGHGGADVFATCWLHCLWPYAPGVLCASVETILTGALAPSSCGRVLSQPHSSAPLPCFTGNRHTYWDRETDSFLWLSTYIFLVISS